MKNIPTAIKIFSALWYLGNIIAILVGILSFGVSISQLSFITPLIAVIIIFLGAVGILAARDLAKGKVWAYFVLTLSLLAVIIDSIIKIIKSGSVPGFGVNLVILSVDVLIFVYVISSTKIKEFFGFEKETSPIDLLRGFWNFLKEDSWQSWIVSLVLLVVLIKFIFFPLLSLATGASLPLVVVESCSMYHQGNFDDWWFKYGTQYEGFDIEKEDFRQFPMKNGFNKGDIMFVWGYSRPKLGDIIIFVPNHDSTAKHPIIHRVVTESPLGTKGDNGITNPRQLNGQNTQKLDETNIKEEQVVGKAILKVPALGWIKLIFFELSRKSEQRGFCN